MSDLRPATQPPRTDSIAPVDDPLFAPAESGTDLRDLWDIALRGKWTILACILAAAIPTAVWSIAQPSMFDSYAVILVDKKGDGNLGGVLSQQGPASFFSQERNLANEVLVVQQSLPLAEAVARQVLTTPVIPGTRRRPTVLEVPEGAPAPTVRDVALRLQAGYVTAAQESPEVDAMRITGVSTDPAEAAYLANVYADAFAALTRDQSREGMNASRTFLEAQVAEKGQELAGYDEAVRDFMNREGAVALDQETSQLVSQIAALQAERDEADVQIQIQQATVAALEGELARVQPRLAARPAADLDGQLAAAQTRVRELQARLSPYYARNPELRSAPDSEVEEFIRVLRAGIAREEAAVSRLAGQIAAAAAAGSGGGPGDTQSGFARSAQLRAQISDARTALEGAKASRDALASRLADYDRELAAIPSQSIDLARLQRDRMSAERLYQSLDQNLQEAQVAEQGELGYARVIRPAFLASAPFAPNRLRNVLLAAIGGFLFGVTLAIARVRLDHRLSRPDNIQKLGLTLLGTIPDFSTIIRKDFGGKDFVEVGGRQLDTRLVTLLNPMATASETYRALRTSVQFSRPDAVVQTILVTSASPGEGKSVTSANLALVLAQAGRRVLLVDCDLRRPTVHKKFGLSREPGLSHALFADGDFNPDALAQPADDLFVLPAGQIVPNPSELLGSKRMRDFLETMRGRFDIIVLDAPPVHAATDAVLLSTQADATVVVARAGSTKDYDLEAALDALNGVGARLIGIVLNGFDISLAYGYKYRYTYRYGSDYAYGHENLSTEA
ncbi:MAG TPA: polysaccharide biosynthesis tyrosine autokinase [Rubricoccaceae bacterium]|jgi:tyrosine-protein kinase Etk/Wzc